VVGHDHPRPQFIILSMPETERIFNEPGDFRSLEMTNSPSLVQVSLQFDPPLAVVFDLQQRLPFGAQFFRESIRQSEGDELNQPWFVAVRKITTFMPSLKSMLNILLGEGNAILRACPAPNPRPRIMRRTRKALGIHGQVFSCRSIL